MYTCTHTHTPPTSTTYRPRLPNVMPSMRLQSDCWVAGWLTFGVCNPLPVPLLKPRRGRAADLPGGARPCLRKPPRGSASTRHHGAAECVDDRNTTLLAGPPCRDDRLQVWVVEERGVAAAVGGRVAAERHRPVATVHTGPSMSRARACQQKRTTLPTARRRNADVRTAQAKVQAKAKAKGKGMGR